MEYQYTYKSKIGNIMIVEANKKIIKIARGTEIDDKNAGYIEKETDLIKETIKQINEYLDGEREYFDLPIRLIGTSFQVKAWRAIMKIPYGETRSYQDIAKAIGKPRAYRAVGSSTRIAPLSLIIPCHRVVKSGGDIGSFGDSMDLKIMLLDFERNNIK